MVKNRSKGKRHLANNNIAELEIFIFETACTFLDRMRSILPCCQENRTWNNRLVCRIYIYIYVADLTERNKKKGQSFFLLFSLRLRAWLSRHHYLILC
jgi:hypothetical protein